MLYFQITSERQRDHFEHTGGPIELGRAPGEECERFLLQDRFVSRRQLRIEEISPVQVSLENLGSVVVTLSDGSALSQGESRTLELPVKLTVGFTHIEISGSDRSGASPLQTIAAPAQIRRGHAPASLISLGRSPSPETLTHWFESLLSVQRAAAGSAEFYAETASAVVDLVGLDRGLVVLRENDAWKVAASHSPHSRQPVRYSETVLAEVLRQGRTFYEASLDPATVPSLAEIEAYVASPVLDPLDRVIGVVFGSRDARPGSKRNGIEPLEAQVVQMLAGSVSVGLARVKQEIEASRLQVQLEQFASPEVVRALRQDPHLLEASDREITVLFTDLRGFSRIAERLGAAETFRLVRDVMDCFTGRIVEHEGFIIHYAGDGLAAMWNAPTSQPDHALRACRAALAMQAEMPALNQQWSGTVGRRLEIGVGINTGPASVGNAGSRQRLKFGALGHTVNLASRVEGATKQLGLPILITAATQEQVGDALATRRLCRVRAVGIEQPVEVWEVHGDNADSDWVARRNLYEQALAASASGRLVESRRLLQRLVDEDASVADVATQWLSQRVNDAEREETIDLVFQLESK